VKKFLITILALLPFILSTCKPDDGNSQVTLGPLYLGEAADYIYFLEGSWWKYQNTKTNEIDSTVLTSSYLELKNYTCSDNTNWIQKEDITFTTESKTICSNRNYRIRQAWGCRPNNTLNKYFEFFVQDGCKNFSESVTFYFPFDLPKSGSGGQDVIFNKLHDSLKVQNQWYQDVAEFEIDNDPTYERYKYPRTKYFWAKNIGLLKKEKYSISAIEPEEAWELIDHNVIQ
jgi:hypothetical protein